MDAQPREAEGTAFGRSDGDAEATADRERWRFTSACSGELGGAGYTPSLFSFLSIRHGRTGERCRHLGYPAEGVRVRAVHGNPLGLLDGLVAQLNKPDKLTTQPARPPVSTHLNDAPGLVWLNPSVDGEKNARSGRAERGPHGSAVNLDIITGLAESTGDESASGVWCGRDADDSDVRA